MDRQITTAVRNALLEPTTQVITMAFLDFPGDPLFAHDSIGDIVADLHLDPPHSGNQTYMGLGTLVGAYNSVEDSSERPTDYSMTMVGADPDLLQHARGVDHQGRESIVWLAVIDMATGRFIGTLDVLKRGRMDEIDFNLQEQEIIEVHVEDERARMNGGPGILYDDGQQRLRNPNPLGTTPPKADGFMKAALFDSKKVVIGPGHAGFTDRNSVPPSRNEYSTTRYR